MARMVGYARVGARDQRLFAQMDELRAAGCEEIFLDQGSGKISRESTGLGKLLEYAREGDIVVVTQLDRFSKSLMDLLQLLERLGNQGAQVRSLKEGFDTTTSDGRRVFQLLGVLAEFGREQIRERTLEGLKAARAQGRIGGRPRRLNAKQEEMIWRLHQDGESMRELARMFNVSVGTISRALKRRNEGAETRRSELRDNPD